MTIHQRMSALFEAAEIPGFLQEWRATPEFPRAPDIFCTYIAPLDTPALCADDLEIIHATNVYLHMYGKTDVTPAYDRLLAAAKAAGFYIPTGRDLDDVRNGEYQYHRRLDLVYYDNVDD